MTVLVGFQGNGFSIIAADSRATDESGDMFILANPKVTWDEHEDYIFAICGATRGGNLLQQGWTPPVPPVWKDINELDKFMTQQFIPMLRDHFIESGYDAKWEGESAWMDSGFLVSVQGIIYPIASDYGWDRDIRNVYTAGSGGPIALGALAMAEIGKYANDPKGAEKIIKKAVEKACEWNAYCAAPIVIETQFTE
jgi:ATP-dependent protease HslVU (ClpYQ) peptidase subunit